MGSYMKFWVFTWMETQLAIPVTLRLSKPCLIKGTKRWLKAGKIVITRFLKALKGLKNYNNPSLILSCLLVWEVFEQRHYAFLWGTDNFILLWGEQQEMLVACCGCVSSSSAPSSHGSWDRSVGKLTGWHTPFQSGPDQEGRGILPLWPSWLLLRLSPPLFPSEAMGQQLKLVCVS